MQANNAATIIHDFNYFERLFNSLKMFLKYENLDIEQAGNRIISILISGTKTS